MSAGAVKTPFSRAFLVVVTLGVLAVLTGLAYASPPDASWIPGIYDNADLDDVVVLVAAASGLVGPVDLAGLHVIPPRPPPRRYLPRRHRSAPAPLLSTLARLLPRRNTVQTRLSLSLACRPPRAHRRRGARSGEPQANASRLPLT